MRREKTRPYRAYLLRCWQEEDAASGGKPVWRFSVEEILPFDRPTSRRGEPVACPERSRREPSGHRKLRTAHERRRRGFSSLEALVAFLKAQLNNEQ